MAKKKELDNLALDMIQCKKDGYGCRYGLWKAMKGNTKEVKKDDSLPAGWRLCKYCGKPFKPNTQKQIYCEPLCQNSANMDKYRERKREEERNKDDESCT